MINNRIRIPDIIINSRILFSYQFATAVFSDKIRIKRIPRIIINYHSNNSNSVEDPNPRL